MAFDKDLTRSMAGPVVLSLVSERAMYGYEIIKLVNERTGGAFEWKEGTLYPCLHRLEGAKLVKSEWRLSKEGRQRKYYAATRKGRDLLRDKVSEWSAFSSAVNGSLEESGGGITSSSSVVSRYQTSLSAIDPGLMACEPPSLR